MHLRRVTLHPERYPTLEDYPFNMRLLRETRSLDLTAPVTLFVGENGTGKSTLLRAMCRACGVHIWEGESRDRVHANPFEGCLHQAMEVAWEDGSVRGSYFGSDIFRHFAQLVDEWAASDPGQLELVGGKSLITQSHGQSIMSFFTSRYGTKGIYFLDEPETALSPTSQLQLVEILTQTSRAGHAQFIVATHSPILMACPGAEILSFDQIPLRSISCEETGHFRIYRQLFGEEDGIARVAEQGYPAEEEVVEP